MTSNNVHFQIVRSELTKVVEFQYYEKDRLLLKEDHQSLSMYFVVTGEVLVSKLLPCKESDQNISKTLNVLTTGACFGHLGLIYDITRNASVSTQSRLTMNSLFGFMSFHRKFLRLPKEGRGKWLLNRCVLLLETDELQRFGLVMLSLLLLLNAEDLSELLPRLTNIKQG